jgi:hypothetical protein
MSTLTVPDPRWTTIGKASRYLGVAPQTVRKLITAGRLSVRRLPGAWEQVDLDELDALEAASTAPATEPVEGSAA